MTLSVQKDPAGPDWPLGFIKVVTPGIPVSIMSLVDPLSINDPASPTPGTSGAAEYTVRAYQIQFQGVCVNVAGGMMYNTGFVYILRKPVGGGSGGRSDPGCMVKVLAPGETYFLDAAPQNRNVWSPYRYYIDADNADDGALVTLVIQ